MIGDRGIVIGHDELEYTFTRNEFMSMCYCVIEDLL